MKENIIKESNRKRTKANAILETIQTQNYNIISTIEKESEFSKTEKGFISQTSGSGLKLFDSGSISLKDNKNNGIFINKAKNALLLNAKNISINAKYLHIKTRPDGFILNGYYLNPEVLKSASVAVTENGITKSVPLFIKLNEDNEFEALLKDCGVIE